jgi:uncharacterized protein YprB with RNaseH-like and TPR domain
MLTETFIHVPGVGPAAEKKLWDEGTSDWWKATGHTHGLFSAPRDGPLEQTLRECLRELAEGRLEMTASLLDVNEHWRALCLREKGETRPLRWLALDIETTGLEPGEGTVTAIGICGHATDFQPRALTAGTPGWSDPLPRLLLDSDILITFNGRSFDVPFLARSLQRQALIFPPFHLDLYPLLKKLQQRGGLKRIQKRLGFVRKEQLDEVDGRIAIQLWHEHRRGTPGAMETLVRYCLEDVVVLFDLAVWAYDQAAVRLGRDWRCWRAPRVSLEHLPYDAALVRRLVDGWSNR